MIATLFKHEVRRTIKWFALIILAARAIVGLATLIAVLLKGTIGNIFAGLALVAAIAVPAAVPIWMGVEFYRSSYSKTGYLTRALPVKGTTIYWVKVIVAYLMSLTAILVGFGLVYLANIGITVAAGGSVDDVNRWVANAWDALAAAPGWLVAVMVLGVALLPLQWLASFFVAATVGSEGWANKLGLGGPILVWFLSYAATQTVALLGALIPLQLVIGDGGFSVQTELLNIFGMNDGNIIPLGVFIGIFVAALAGIVWASVSFDRKAELR